MKHVYLAGPMRGYPQFNYPAFDEAALMLRLLGWHVFNPAEHTRKVFGADHGLTNDTGESDGLETMRIVLAADLKFICEKADAVAFMKGWENSSGARAEHATAVALGLELIYMEKLLYV